MLRLLVLLSSLFLLSSAGCTDGKDNLVEIEDVSGGNFDIHFKAVKGYTYNDKNVSSCKSGDAEVCFPGYIKLSSGTITVTQANDLNKTGEVKATLKKNSLLVGTVCKDGKSKTIGVSDKDWYRRPFDHSNDLFQPRNGVGSPWSELHPNAFHSGHLRPGTDRTDRGIQ